MSVDRNEYYIQCEKCLENNTIRDIANGDDITIRIVRDELIEIKCKSCGNEMVVVNPYLFRR